jgi:hypothetical protein
VVAGWALGISVALAVTMTSALLARVSPPSGEVRGGRLGRTSNRAMRMLAWKKASVCGAYVAEYSCTASTTSI